MSSLAAWTVLEGGTGEPPWLVVALHGYGDAGSPFARQLVSAARVPRALVAAPCGPLEAALVPGGRAWYPLTAHRDEMTRRSRALGTTLRPRVAQVQRARGVPAARTALVAFSQGTTVACTLLDVAVCARAVLLCGRVTAAPDGCARPDLLVVAGQADRFGPPAVIARDVADAGLSGSAALVTVEGLGHTLSSEVADLAMSFATTGSRDTGSNSARQPARAATRMIGTRP